MHIQNQNRTTAQAVTAWQQILMFVGFVSFITGIFSFVYSLLAWYLLPFSSDVLGFALIGLLAAYIGRKSLRQAGKEVTL
ncbi:MAG: sorbitol-specific phosphotransferase system component IIBC [Glaciecola sp.]|jgi:sorbitol-specific phosphotransferase system component IIBC